MCVTILLAVQNCIQVHTVLRLIILDPGEKIQACLSDVGIDLTLTHFVHTCIYEYQQTDTLLHVIGPEKISAGFSSRHTFVGMGRE